METISRSFFGPKMEDMLKTCITFNSKPLKIELEKCVPLIDKSLTFINDDTFLESVKAKIRECKNLDHKTMRYLKYIINFLQTYEIDWLSISQIHIFSSDINGFTHFVKITNSQCEVDHVMYFQYNISIFEKTNIQKKTVVNTVVLKDFVKNFFRGITTCNCFFYLFLNLVHKNKNSMQEIIDHPFATAFWFLIRGSLWASFVVCISEMKPYYSNIITNGIIGLSSYLLYKKISLLK